MPIPQQEYQHGSLERLRTRSSIKKGLGPLITQLGPGGPELQFAQIPLGICCWKVNRFFSEDVPIHHKTIMIFLSFQTASCLHKNLGNNMSPCWSWTPGRQKYWSNNKRPSSGRICTLTTSLATKERVSSETRNSGRWIWLQRNCIFWIRLWKSWRKICYWIHYQKWKWLMSALCFTIWFDFFCKFVLNPFVELGWGPKELWPVGGLTPNPWLASLACFAPQFMIFTQIHVTLTIVIITKILNTQLHSFGPVSTRNNFVICTSICLCVQVYLRAFSLNGASPFRICCSKMFKVSELIKQCQPNSKIFRGKKIRHVRMPALDVQYKVLGDKFRKKGGEEVPQTAHETCGFLPGPHTTILCTSGSRGPWGPGPPPCPQNFSKSCSFQAKGNPLVWANFGLRAPLGSKLCWARPWPKSWIRHCCDSSQKARLTGISIQLPEWLLRVALPQFGSAQVTTSLFKHKFRHGFRILVRGHPAKFWPQGGGPEPKICSK